MRKETLASIFLERFIQAASRMEARDDNCSVSKTALSEPPSAIRSLLAAQPSLKARVMGELPLTRNQTWRLNRPARETGERVKSSQRADYLGAIQVWNGRLIDHLRCIRILESVRWRPEVEHAFLAREGHEPPCISLDEYRHTGDCLDITERLADLRRLERDIVGRLGTDDPAARLLLRRCRSSQDALRLIAARGTREFVWLSREIFGTSLASPAVRDRLNRLITFLEASQTTDQPETRVTAEVAAEELAARLAGCFGNTTVGVRLADGLQSDASAGPSYLKLRRDATFTREDINLLEAHESWVHIGTMLNGKRQPLFSVLSKCCPCVTSTQEGLAVLTELLAGVCHSQRRQRLALRLRAVMMAEDGADFMEVFRFFRARLPGDRDAYRHACRVFRGSLPNGAGPFTKDLSYGLGLIELVAKLRTLADDARTVSLLFSGKTCVDDLQDLASLHDAGLLVAGEFVPLPFRDPRAFRQGLRDLNAW